MGWDREENYAKKKDLENYTKKNTFNRKVEEIECTLETKITRDDLPDLTSYVKKDQLPPQQDLSKYALKESLNTKAEISEVEKRLCISDFEKHKTESQIKYAKKDEIPKDYLTEKDLPDLSPFATKEEIPKTSHLVEKDHLKHYLLKKDIDTTGIEICYCMVKLKNNFRIYDGTDWEFEFYMGNRGDWQVLHDTHKMLSKPQEYAIHAPFSGLFYIDFCFTCQKDSYLLKPRALQRIRSSAGEFINWKYHATQPETVQTNSPSWLSFRNHVEVPLKKGDWIKCSMQFDNRLHNHKKNWLHAMGSVGSYTPTYFCVRGIKYNI